MRIAEISANYGRGGPGGVMKDLARYATEHGHTCRVYYGRGEKPDGIDSERIGSDLSVYGHALKARLFDCSGFSSKSATRKLAESLAAFHPDVIHLHNLLGYYLDIETLFLYLKASAVPVVWTLHDCWAFTGHCINFERVGCEKWLTGCFDCALKTDYPESFFSDRSARNYAKKRELFRALPDMALVTPSEWLSGLVSRSFLKDRPRYVIHNGVDTAFFKPTESDIRQRYGIGDRCLLLAVAGVWNEMKGIGLLREIAEGLPADYRVAVIGHSEGYPLPDSVIRIPRTENRRQLVEWYSAADMLINPTFGDNYPTVNLEALSCGTPVVTNQTGGSGEAAGNTFGRIVASKTADEFLEKIDEVCSENYKREDIRAYALRFDQSATAEKYLDLFSCLSGGK